ncbi:MAG TPA: Si-specific NAD(P)(+) transhydrogenase [Actinomycetes bacterium]|jgi:NAD(P) transhydrogenase|nr:Si-specific NAD(P)(+) transhydrogenase [Actinomycetes bacterium]
MDDSFDMIVIGAGPAGEKAAVQAAWFGKRVAVVDQAASPGGSAVRSAGVPTLALRETASYLTGFRRRDTYGLSLQLLPALALERLLARTAEVIATRTQAVRANLDRHGVQLLRGQARLAPGPSVVVRAGGGPERTLQAGVIVLATGSRPLRPADIPFEDPDVHDSETIIALDRIPRTMVVIGGGPVGCEYASVFTALGVEVTLLDRADRVLPFMDTEISDVLARAFAGMGMRLALGSGAGAVERAGGQLQVTLAGGQRLHPDKVLFVAGRAGTTEGLGLQDAGVKTDGRGRIIVDQTYRTTAEGIYAAGDVIGPPALASVSMEQGRVAATHAFGIDFKQTMDPLPPHGVYCIPEAAMVGMTEQAAKGAGIDCEVGRGWFQHSPRAQIAGATEGLIKLVFRRDDRRLLGVHIVGEIAGELIHQGQAAIGAGEPIDTFIDRTFNLPTYSETYKYAAYDGLQRLQGTRP